MTSNFEKQKAIGIAGEDKLDEFYSRSFLINKISALEFQRLGIDRIFRLNEPGSFYFSVEYKTDHAAANTGNAFVELNIIRETDKEPGWARKLMAHFLFYYVPGLRVCYCISVVDFKFMLPNWREQYGTKLSVVTQRETGGHYQAKGLIVPLKEFSSICWRRDTI